VGILPCDVGVRRCGTLAERVVVPSASVVSITPHWSLEEMAAAPLVYLTAWQALTQWSEPRAPPPSSVILITGASGGVGTASVQLAGALGLVVVALSRSVEKRGRLLELGADFAFDPSDPNLQHAISAAIAPRKVSLAIDNVGGALFNQIIRLLDRGGKISVVGRSAGVVPEFNTATLLFRRNRIGGVSVSDYSPERAQVIWREIVKRLSDAGKKPVIDRIFPFEEVKAAFTRLDEGLFGKVVVRING
jgi:NADPH2:quinone reductase